MENRSQSIYVDKTVLHIIDRIFPREDELITTMTTMELIKPEKLNGINAGMGPIYSFYQWDTVKSLI